MTLRGLWWSFVATLVLLPQVAFADAYEDALVRAVAAKERALEQQDQAAWEETFRLFRVVDGIRRGPDTQYELARAAEQLGRFDLAVEGYEVALELGLAGRARERATRFLEKRGGQVGRIVVRGASGASVVVNGEPRGQLPLQRPIAVLPGRVEIEVRGEEAAWRGTTTIRAGQVLHIKPAEPRPKPVTPDRASATTAAAAPEPAARPVTSPPAQPAASVPPSPPPPAVTEVAASSPSRLGVGLTVAGGAILLVSGIIVPVAARGVEVGRMDLARYCEQQRGDTCPSPYAGQSTAAQDAVDAIETWKNIGIAGFVGLGVGLLTTTVGVAFLARSSSASARAAPVRLSLGPDGGGILVAGTFGR